MKINVTNPEPEFKPVTLSLTLESQSEVDAIFALFESVKLDRALQALFDVSLPGAYGKLNPSPKRLPHIELEETLELK